MEKHSKRGKKIIDLKEHIPQLRDMLFKVYDLFAALAVLFHGGCLQRVILLA